VRNKGQDNDNGVLQQRGTAESACSRWPTGRRTAGAGTACYESGRCGAKQRFDGFEQRMDAERDVLDLAVDEEGRRSAHAAVAAALLVLAHTLQVDVIVHLRAVAHHIKTQLLGVLMQLMAFSCS
jgi:hypothetical protein